MLRYDSTANLESRAFSLYEWGHDSSVWYTELRPSTEGHVVEIVSPHYVSRPCWEEVFEAAYRVDTVSIEFFGLIDWVDSPEEETVYRFFFDDFNVAKKMALRVQNSARNRRKDAARRIRIEEAGGFHNQEVLVRLFEIQQGRCYYSGDPLRKQPKNFVVDHIVSIYLGGSDWPGNLALVTKELNTWKGGHASAEDTLRWLAKKRGKSWMRSQKEFCREVDRKRENLDQEFRSQHE